MANGLPGADAFNAGRVTNPGASERIKQRLFDYQLYPTAGIQQLSFFQSPVGQGVTSALGAAVGSAKTQWDTNMNLGGQLPSGMMFLIESIELDFQPGSSSVANTFLPAAVQQFVGAATATTFATANDVNLFYASGMLELNVLQKNYLRETPLKCFPPKAHVSMDAALSTTVATSSLALINSRADGRPYYIEGGITLQPATNFEILLKWPSAIATPSGFNARVGVILDGYILRASQ